MKTEITVNIKNLIRNYCSNFLSYLYEYRGWKRTMFDMAKQNIIFDDIRIVITSVGDILIYGSSMVDILNAMEFLITEFQYGRMEYYCVFDENVTIKTSFTSYFHLDRLNTIDLNFLSSNLNRLDAIDLNSLSSNLNNFPYNKRINLDCVTIQDNQAIIKYCDYDKGQEILKCVSETFAKEIPESPMIEISETSPENEFSIFPEILTLSFFSVYLTLKLLECSV